MALTSYKAFVDRMISRYEGGYGWNRKETGGPTKYGITCFDLAEHRGQKMSSMATWAPIVQAMQLPEAEAIYQTKYANAIRYNDLPAGPDVEMLDYGVNSGISRPIRVVRAILGVPGQAVMDQKLLDAIRKADPARLVSDISAEGLHFMHAIRQGSAWQELGGGWGARVADLKTYALHLLSEPGAVPEPVAPDLTKVAMPKAAHGDPDVTTKTLKTATATAVASGAGSHFAGVPLELVLVIVGFVIVVGIAYVLYHKQQSAALNSTAILPPVALPPIPPRSLTA